MAVRARLRRSFLAGLVLLTPLAVTLFVFRVLVNWSLGVVNPVVRNTRLVRYTANIELVAQVIAVLLIVLGVLLVGTLAEMRVGRRLFGNFGRVLNFVPLVNTVYSSVRRITTSLVERDTGYERVVLVEHPREGLYALGLVTAESPVATEAVTGEPAYNVFLPNSPNPTAGRLVVVPEGQVHEIDLSTRRAMRLLVTMGMDENPETLASLDGATAAGDGGADAP